MSAESLRIINKAISRVNGNTIATVDDGTPEAIVADLNYEDEVESELCKRSWKFARKAALLVADADDPIDTDYDHQLTFPANVLKLRTVIKDGKTIDYQIDSDTAGDKFILADEDEDCYAIFTFRAAEDDWPADFEEAFVKRLMAHFLRREERYADAERIDAAADDGFRLAAINHAQEEPGKDPSIGNYSLLNARRLGYAPRRQ